MKPEDFQFVADAPSHWEHQQHCFLEQAARRHYYLAWEQRCGKTRPTLEHAAFQYENGAVDAVLIFAWPGMVHYNWVREEIPLWLPERIHRKCLVWFAGRQNHKGWNREFDELLKYKGLAVFSVSAYAISGVKAAVKEYVKRFLKSRKVFLVIDEVDWARTPGAQRSKQIYYFSKHKNVVSKRLLTGTPGDNPFDFYWQYRILKDDFWKNIGVQDFQTYKRRFAEYETETNELTGEVNLKIGINHNIEVRDPKTGVLKYLEYPIQVEDDEGKPKYRNLEQLQQTIAPYTSRILRSDISDAPPKVYQPLYYEPSAEQLRVYNELHHKYEAELADQSTVQAHHVLTRWLRFQQILSNFYPPHDEGQICANCDGAGCEACDNIGVVLVKIPLKVIDEKHNPRLEATLNYIASNHGPTIIWARFTYEVDQIIDAISQQLSGRTARYDGQVDKLQREQNRIDFQQGKYDYLVGNQSAGQRGVRMDRGELVIFYSNMFSLVTRQQTEDRTEMVDRKISTGVVDLIARGTIDEKIRDVLRGKYDVSTIINGDNWRAWI